MTTLLWPEIFFIRHGETPWNAERRYQGRQDIPLNDTGRAQADRNGHTLKALLHKRGLDPRVLEWHASPLSRTRETMERVRAAFEVALPAVAYDVRLVEISFGRLEGMLHSELPANMATAPGGRDASYWEFRPEGGENYRDVEVRINDFGTILGGPAVIVAHGGILRTLRVLIEGAPVDEIVNWPPPQDRVLHFKDGTMQAYGAQDFD